MARDAELETPDSDDRPVSDLTQRPVYTRDGYRLGRVAGVAVDLDAARATWLLVGDVDEDAFPDLTTGYEGVRVPYGRIAGIADVVVVDVPAAACGAGDAPARDAPDDDRTDAGPSDADSERHAL